MLPALGVHSRHSSPDDPKVSVPSPKSLEFRCVQNGPPARRSEPDWQLESAYLNRYVTDEQRGRRPIFNATLRAAARSAVFPRCSLLTYRSRYARRYCQSGSNRLEKHPTDLRRNPRDLGDGTLATP